MIQINIDIVDMLFFSVVGTPIIYVIKMLLDVAFHKEGKRR